MLVEPPFTLTQMRYFVAAAEAGSMTDAARTLVVSQSAVSTAMAALERQLGVHLFVRHHARGLSLTPAGKRFLREARSFLTHANDLADAARGLGLSLAGSLAVGCFSPFAPFYLPPVLNAFATAYPQVELEIIEGETESLRQQLIRGRCEVAVLYDLHLGEEIDIELVTAVPPYLAVRKGHRLAGAGPVDLREVADEDMVLLDLPHSRDYFLGLAEQHGFTPRVRWRSTNFETVRALVGQGFGYSILNQQPATDSTYDGGCVSVVPLAGEPQGLPVVLATARGVRPTARGRAWAATCRDLLPEVTRGRAWAATCRDLLPEVTRAHRTD